MAQLVRDAAVKRAVDYIERHYAGAVTVELLARHAGVSRTVLGERFAAALGQSPMRYCANWRLDVAARLLEREQRGVADIAYAVGFGSEAAFNRAFRRRHGQPPASWRRQRSTADAALPQQTVRYCHARDGTRLAWSSVGSGFPLVKTANWLNHLEFDWQSPVWRHWLRALTRGNRLVRYDERGNGLSAWDVRNLAFDDFVDDLETVVEAAGIEQFDLLALSQGASVAIAYSLRHPGRVRRLVLLGGYALGWARRCSGEELARREALMTLTRTGWASDSPAYRHLFTSLYIPGGTPQQLAWWTQLQQVCASPANAERLQRTMSTIDVEALLPHVAVPTLVAHARGDQVIPFSCGEHLAAHIPGALFLPLDSDNHVLLEHEPAWEAFLAGLKAFLAG